MCAHWSNYMHSKCICELRILLTTTLAFIKFLGSWDRTQGQFLHDARTERPTPITKKENRKRINVLQSQSFKFTCFVSKGVQRLSSGLQTPGLDMENLGVLRCESNSETTKFNEESTWHLAKQQLCNEGNVLAEHWYVFKGNRYFRNTAPHLVCLLHQSEHRHDMNTFVFCPTPWNLRKT